MASLNSEAIVLSTLRYGETSKIVRLAMPESGVVSAIAKGALRPRSRFGAALQTLSLGTAQVILSARSDLHQLVAFDALHIPLALSQELGRYAAGLALAELLQRCGPADGTPAVYDTLRRGLRDLETAPEPLVDATALRALWHLVSALGFAPRVESCVVDGVPLSPQEPLHFSVRDGGALCATCSRTRPGTVLPCAARAALAALLSREMPLPVLDRPHAAAHRRLLALFIAHQIAEGATLRALDFWRERPWERT